MTPAVSLEAQASSLPPTPAESSAAPTTRKKSEVAILEKNSVVRKKAVAILAMRAQGYTNDEIARELKIKTASVSHYLWRATKSGLITGKLNDPKEVVEFELATKVVRNLNEMLDSNDDAQRERATKLVAEGSLFKQFDQKSESVNPQMNVLAIRIEMPTGGAPLAIPGNVGGSPSFEEGEILGS